MFSSLALAALVVEAIAGYPGQVFARIGHPVTWIGRVISWCDRHWNTPAVSARNRRLNGVATVMLLLAGAIGGGAILHVVIDAVAGPWVGVVIEAALASSLVAQRSLDDHVGAVADALDHLGLDAGQKTVAMVVGRDTTALDEAGVCRAAIESLAENFSDGVVAPLFWMVVAGLPGALAYKAINTADSMIGHKTERYLDFGWAAARTDDVINLPASRLSVVWLALAALVLRGANPIDALRTVWRDAGRHKSPNAGWPEAAMAGALGFRIAGPRVYDGVVVATAWMGHGRAELTAQDIRRALGLYRTACVWQAVAIALLAAAIVLS